MEEPRLREPPRGRLPSGACGSRMSLESPHNLHAAGARPSTCSPNGTPSNDPSNLGGFPRLRRLALHCPLDHVHRLVWQVLAAGPLAQEAWTADRKEDLPNRFPADLVHPPVLAWTADRKENLPNRFPAGLVDLLVLARELLAPSRGQAPRLRQRLKPLLHQSPLPPTPISLWLRWLAPSTSRSAWPRCASTVHDGVRLRRSRTVG